ncbi:uncharacterized protein NDAI_0E03140 [Naumovozyma dairenensis CBS 421]|uniref:CCHC-type domain-containing protein n=1 Tax=Naumovozyma dairenensis (strain ATCC 10597 / BCRC 20456 / CBS 421 / NBRC 0211 / NRRL Y-12639) TaxID=1071378 RepID=G0WBL1_NAUDC|nr:hypothetical protein NDAI_0E03140 [Naumovozyma dairenensis CBS 421]CCD25131.1 hypothetical protein NDAI_0E03140 [Naumovozyma dairenensis CBS 421]
MNQTSDSTSQGTERQSNIVSFLKIVKTFKGEPDEYFTWKAAMQGNKELFEVSDRQFMAGLYNYFEGNPANWLKNTTFNSYEEFWITLDTKYQFDKNNEIATNFRLLMSPPKNIRTYREYVNHFENRLALLPADFKDSSWKLACFLFLLQLGLQDAIRSQDPQNVQEAIVIGENRSVMFKDSILDPRFCGLVSDVHGDNTKGNHQFNQSAIVCFNCGRSEHKSNECRNSHGRHPGRHRYNQKSFRKSGSNTIPISDLSSKN